MSYIGKQPRKAALTASDIEDGIITAAKIEDGAVVAAEIASNAVTTAKINADAVTGAKIADDAINSEHYTDGSIDTAHIADGQVTTAKLATAVFTGATDIGADIADADLFLMDDGAGGTIRKTAASRIKTYAGGLTGVSTGSGNVTITDGNLVVASGHGVDFAASSGSLFDDYEEGTWTPGMTTSGGSLSGVSYGSYNKGWYTKIGRNVTLNFNVQLSSKGSGGSGGLVGSGVKGLANGGKIGKGGLFMVGEKGPELVNLPAGSAVYNNQQTRGMMGGNTINVSVSGRVGASDAELDDIARKIGRKINLEMNRYNNSGYRA